jgi:DNA-binding CsgD family transcriptional regulator
VSLLERALSLMSGHAAGTALADLLDLLLQAYGDSGKFDRAFALADRLREFPGLTAIQRAVLHIRAAAVYDLAGRWSDGVAELDLARVLLGPAPADEHVASLDAIASELALNAQIPERMVEAERLARRALAAAERSHQPAIACRAWLTMAVIARRRDIVEADSYLRRARALAEVHRLPGLRTNTQYLLGVHSWLADSSTAGLQLAREDALRVGAVTVFCAADASLALNLLLRGEFAEGSRLITQQARTVHRLQMLGTYRYLMMAAATAAAHQGRRQAMEQALAEFYDAGGAQSKEQALALGLAQAFCSLLEEDMDGAVEILTQLSKRDQDHPTSFSLDGRHGLQPFLDVLRGQLEPAELEEVRAAPGSTMRWNRQFVLLADAVLLGRAGRPEEAADRFAQAQQAAAIYPMARNLGLRLVTEHAYLDGWGAPREWLGAAEDYFYTAGIPVVASACRALLRRFGLPVRQWRTGTHLVPPHLRVLGVTIRELEVLEMLVQHLPNKEIASRLHISPRTVEKHVASLMTKFSQPNRQAVITYATSMPHE